MGDVRIKAFWYTKYFLLMTKKNLCFRLLAQKYVLLVLNGIIVLLIKVQLIKRREGGAIAFFFLFEWINDI